MKRYRHYTDPPSSAWNGGHSSSNSFIHAPPPSNNYFSNWSTNYGGGQSSKHPRLSQTNDLYRPRPPFVAEPWRRSMPNITVNYNCSKKESDQINESKINKRKEKNKKRWEKRVQKLQQKKEEGQKNDEPNNEQNGQNGGFKNKIRNNPLPDRWNNYSIGIGRPLENTRFLPFKCPLGPEFFQSRKNIKPFNVQTITEHVTSMNGQLGLVVDLTATNRYYDSSLWSEYEVKYEKHSCPGQSVNTNEHSYRRFAISINRFLQQNADNEKLIGVHCTHGLNRTGYLICRFLIEEKGWTAKRALECFAEARGYPIERENYIQTLYQIENRFNGRRE